MDKKDYCKLLDMHSVVFDQRLRYKTELRAFVYKAFEMYGNRFVYRCNTHSSWKAMSEDEDYCFCATDDLPVCLNINSFKGSGQDFYPTYIRLKEYEDGRKIILADGFNWTEDEWQKNRRVLETVLNLEALADFVKEVLEQELDDVE